MKLNFVKKTSSKLYPVKKHLEYQEHSPRNTKDVECHKIPIRINRQKISRRTRQISKKKVMGCEFQQNCKL